MRVEQIMTRHPACCTADTPLQEVARLMVECNCGEIPVVEGQKSLRPVGVVTDRDIVCRIVADGRNPLELTARACMSTAVVTVTPDTSLEDCIRIMEENQIRRVPVVDAAGICCGIVSQADVAKHAPKRETAELVKEVSRESQMPSRVMA